MRRRRASLRTPRLRNGRAYTAGTVMCVRDRAGGAAGRGSAPPQPPQPLRHVRGRLLAIPAARARLRALRVRGHPAARARARAARAVACAARPRPQARALRAPPGVRARALRRRVRALRRRVRAGRARRLRLVRAAAVRVVREPLPGAAAVRGGVQRTRGARRAVRAAAPRRRLHVPQRAAQGGPRARLRRRAPVHHTSAQVQDRQGTVDSALGLDYINLLFPI